MYIFEEKHEAPQVLDDHYVALYPMSVQSVKKRNGCTLATAHKKFQHTLDGAKKKRQVLSLAGAE